MSGESIVMAAVLSHSSTTSPIDASFESFQLDVSTGVCFAIDERKTEE